MKKIILTTCVLLIFMGSFLQSLSPRSGLQHVVFHGQRIHVDLCTVLTLKKAVEKDVNYSLVKFQKKHPQELLLFYKPILKDAILRGQFLIIQFFLKSETYDIPEDMIIDIIWISVRYRRPDIFLIVIEKYPHLQVPNSSLMHIAVAFNNMMLIDKVYQYQDDIDVKDSHGRTPLHVAMSECSSGIVRFFCDRGADIYSRDDRGKTPLDLAKKEKKVNLLYDFLTRNLLNNDDDIQDLFRLGIETVNVVVVLKLIRDYPSYVNKQDKKGRIPLHYAVERGRVFIQPLIIEGKSRIDIRDGRGGYTLTRGYKRRACKKRRGVCDIFCRFIERSFLYSMGIRRG